MQGGSPGADSRSRRVGNTEERHLGKLASFLLQLQLGLVPGLLWGVTCTHYNQVPEWDACLSQKSWKESLFFLFPPHQEFGLVEIHNCQEVLAYTSLSLQSPPSFSESLMLLGLVVRSNWNLESDFVLTGASVLGVSMVRVWEVGAGMFHTCVSGHTTQPWSKAAHTCCFILL